MTIQENHDGYDTLRQRLDQLHQEHPQAHFHVRIDAAGQYANNLERFLRGLPWPMTISASPTTPGATTPQPRPATLAVTSSRAETKTPNSTCKETGPASTTPSRAARDVRTSYLFDVLDRQTVMIDANSQRVTTLLDAANNVVEMKDQLGNTTRYVYDALNRKVVTIDPREEAYRTTVAYDPGGYVVQLTDPSEAHTVTKFDYDALGRKIRQVEEVGSSIPATFAYDGVGLLISSTDRLGRRRDFEYDALNRMTTQVWLNSSGTPVETFTYAFDAVGNQTSAGNATHRYTMAYDSRHRVTGVQEPFSQSLAFAYDAADNRIKVEDSQGGLRTSTYDALNRLVTIQHTGEATLRVDQTYNPVDRPETVTRYSTLDTTTKVGSTTLMYDALDRLTVLIHRDGAATPNVLAHYTYTYDNAHRLTVENLDSTLTSYSYDEANQLTWDSSATPTFTYEGAGNRTNSGYTTDAGNRLTNDGTWTYTYDAEGNLTKKSKGAEDETWWYGYDHRNQLTSAIKRDVDDEEATIQREAEYKYDVYANRIEQKVDTDGDDNPDIIEHYALDGWKILQGPLGDRHALRGNENWDIWADLDGLNSDALKTRNIHGDAIDQIFARIGAPGTATETNWLLSDRLGTVRNIADSSGTGINTIAYDGFGNILSQTDSSLTGRYTFTSREKDYETGLQHHRARYYDPKTARWMSHDPLGFDAGDSNLYRYVMNKPTAYGDPSGLIPPPSMDGGLRLDYAPAPGVDPAKAARAKLESSLAPWALPIAQPPKLVTDVAANYARVRRNDPYKTRNNFFLSSSGLQNPEGRLSDPQIAWAWDRGEFSYGQFNTSEKQRLHQEQVTRGWYLQQALPVDAALLEEIEPVLAAMRADFEKEAAKSNLDPRKTAPFLYGQTSPFFERIVIPAPDNRVEVVFLPTEELRQLQFLQALALSRTIVDRGMEGVTTRRSGVGFAVPVTPEESMQLYMARGLTHPAVLYPLRGNGGLQNVTFEDASMFMPGGAFVNAARTKLGKFFCNIFTEIVGNVAITGALSLGTGQSGEFAMAAGVAGRVRALATAAVRRVSSGSRASAAAARVRPARPPANAPVANHHAIPHSNTIYNHEANDLVRASGRNLRDYAANQRDLINHVGRHEPAYHLEVRRRMNAAWSELNSPGFRKLPAERQQSLATARLDAVIDSVFTDIGNGSLWVNSRPAWLR